MHSGPLYPQRNLTIQKDRIEKKILKKKKFYFMFLNKSNEQKMLCLRKGRAFIIQLTIIQQSQTSLIRFGSIRPIPKSGGRVNNIQFLYLPSSQLNHFQKSFSLEYMCNGVSIMFIFICSLRNITKQ